MEEYWSHLSESGSSEDCWTYNSSSPIQSSCLTFDSNFCKIQSSYNFQNTHYQDGFYAYNDIYYTSNSSSKIEEKPEISEDSCSEGEVQTLCKTGQEVNCSLNSKSASTKGGM